MKFIRSLFSDVNGSISSKRLVMFALTGVFILVTLVNLFTGKNIDDVLKSQLFYLVIWVLSMVFGEQVVGIFKKPTPIKPDELLSGEDEGGGDRPKKPPINP